MYLANRRRYSSKTRRRLFSKTRRVFSNLTCIQFCSSF